MRQNRKEQPVRGALEIIEEAVHVLRRSSVTQIASYYVGSLPFVLGFLYFWADMSRSAFAQRHCAEAAIGLSLLFLWMKFWQAVFTRGVKERVYGEPETDWNFLRVARLIRIQAVNQPVGLFLLPVALLITIPFGWAYAFFQNILMVGTDSDDLKTLCKKSMQQALIWPGQNHMLLSVMFLFGLFIFINLAFALLVIPVLLNMLLGLDTLFTQNGMHILNTTFLTTVCGLTYLCIDPLIKTAYVLRSFYGDSIKSGVDLRVGLKTLFRPRRVVAGLLVLLLLASSDVHAASGVGIAEKSARQTFTPLAKDSSVLPGELDRSISEVLNQREYTWRMPRKNDEAHSSVIQSFIMGLMDWLGGLFRSIWNWLGKIINWLKKLLPERIATGEGAQRSISDWMELARVLIFLLLAAVVCGLLILLWQFWKRSRSRSEETLVQPALAQPDPGDENVTANDLPSVEWGVLARELMDKGELRLAMRALYLAGLAYLAEKEMVIIAKFKSDRDYERDLRRRIHVKPDLLNAFSQNLMIFESVWYGMHELTRRELQSFTANLERIKIGA